LIIPVGLHSLPSNRQTNCPCFVMVFRTTLWSPVVLRKTMSLKGVTQGC
jgi:hypothetical protein